MTTHKCPQIFFLVGMIVAGPGCLAASAESGFAVEDEVILEEIIVTAQKRKENLQQVPISITAFSAERIEESGIDSPMDVAARTPNLDIAQSFTVGNSFVTVRGVSQINNSDSPIAVVVDEIYLTQQKQLVRELFDLDRVEVLRGPQGALYGRNSLGGVLSIVTRPPTDVPDLRIWTSGSNGGGLSFAAAGGGALIDRRLLLRAGASFKTFDGLIDNVFLDRKADFHEDRSGRLQLRWQASEIARFDFRAAASKTEGGAVFYSLVPTEGFANDTSSRPQGNILGSSERSMADLSLKFTWTPAWATLTSITAWNDLEEDYFGDGEMSNPQTEPANPFGQLAQSQDLDARQISQELRLASPDDDAVRWTFGGFFQKTDRALTTVGHIDLDGTAESAIPFFVAAGDNDNRAAAAYAQVDFRWGELWRLTSALRYDRDDREQRDPATGVVRDVTFDAWQPRLTLGYQPHDRALFYLTFGSGFRSGGFNAPGVTPQVFDKESNDSLELGFKLTPNHRFTFNGAAYLTRLDGAQYFVFDLLRGGQVIENVREAEMTGFELDVTARLNPNFELRASLGVNDSRIVDFDGSDRFVGNETPNNVAGELYLGGRYTHPLKRNLLATAHLDARLRGRQYWHADNRDVQEPVELVDLRVGLEGASWSIVGWVENLLDEEYFVEYSDAAWNGFPIPFDLAQLNPPRRFGVSLAWHL